MQDVIIATVGCRNRNHIFIYDQCCSAWLPIKFTYRASESAQGVPVTEMVSRRLGSVDARYRATASPSSTAGRKLRAATPCAPTNRRGRLWGFVRQSVDLATRRCCPENPLTVAHTCVDGDFAAYLLCSRFATEPTRKVHRAWRLCTTGVSDQPRSCAISRRRGAYGLYNSWASRDLSGESWNRLAFTGDGFAGEFKELIELQC